jgi:hypothetical protein
LPTEISVIRSRWRWNFVSRSAAICINPVSHPKLREMGLATLRGGLEAAPLHGLARQRKPDESQSPTFDFSTA